MLKSELMYFDLKKIRIDTFRSKRKELIRNEENYEGKEHAKRKFQRACYKI